MGKFGSWTGTGSSDPLTDQEQQFLTLTGGRWYRYAGNPDNPLTYHHPNGLMFRPIDWLLHNYGSAPWILRCIPLFAPTRFPDAYVLHDQCYSYLHQVGVSKDGGKTWAKCRVTRRFADTMLSLSILAGGNSMARRVAARVIGPVVSACGWAAWQ